MLHPTDEEIAAFFNCSTDTIGRRKKHDPDFAEAYKKGFALGKVSLRRAQFKNAVENQNSTIQIWLGKQWLGQTDKTQHEITGKGGGAIDFRTVGEFSDTDLENRILTLLETTGVNAPVDREETKD